MNAFDAVLFSTSADDGSPIRQRLRDAAAQWHDVADLRRSSSRTRMHDANLDVLIDLRGYGDGGVAETLALRPAPVQINWLAYPGTSGAPWIDYVIADRVVLPDALRAHFSEAVAYLPRCFQPSDPTRIVGEPPSRAHAACRRTGPSIVSFNNSYKLNPRSMRRMFAVLRGVPDCVAVASFRTRRRGRSPARRSARRRRRSGAARVHAEAAACRLSRALSPCRSLPRHAAVQRAHDGVGCALGRLSRADGRRAHVRGARCGESRTRISACRS